jgi:2-amino-4-hydroxy-6-hydroxymethyldihydropteridine diphosphokinase
MQELIIGLGSNLGDRRKYLDQAIEMIGKKIGLVTAISSFIETEPWGFQSDNVFLNCAIVVQDESIASRSDVCRPMEILEILQEIEAEFGRVRTGVYTDRVIDLDILFYGNEMINEPQLVVPHPKLQERDFILRSLMEICPNRVHPVTGQSIMELSDSLHRLTAIGKVPGITQARHD